MKALKARELIDALERVDPDLEVSFAYVFANVEGAVVPLVQASQILDLDGKM